MILFAPMAWCQYSETPSCARVTAGLFDVNGSSETNIEKSARRSCHGLLAMLSSSIWSIGCTTPRSTIIHSCELHWVWLFVSTNPSTARLAPVFVSQFDDC